MKSKEENIKKLIKQLKGALKTSSEICKRTVLKEDGWSDKEFPLDLRTGNIKDCYTCPFSVNSRTETCAISDIFYILERTIHYYNYYKNKGTEND